MDEGFRIGDLRVDPEAGEVTGPRGHEQLDPQVMGILVMLAANAGRVVSRENLVNRLWPDGVVTDEALGRCLHELRRQMSAAAGSEHYHALVETIPRRGYRLNATVTPIIVPPRESAARPARKRRWLVLATALLAAAVALLAYRHFARPPADHSGDSGPGKRRHADAERVDLRSPFHLTCVPDSAPARGELGMAID